MTFTSHGHHIRGTGLEGFLNMPTKHCGGIVWCSQCRDESAAYFLSPTLEEDQMDDLTKHAKSELERVGEDPLMTADILKVIKTFADCGFSGATAEYAIQAITRLLRFKGLGLGVDPAIAFDGDGVVPKKTLENMYLSTNSIRNAKSMAEANEIVKNKNGSDEAFLKSVQSMRESGE